MNRFLTYCAQSKLKKIIESSESQAIKLSKLNGFLHLELIRDQSEINSFKDIIISYNPKVLTDTKTIMILENACIDFCYNSNDFIFTGMSK